MAQSKLQVQRALTVVPSDTINIPDPSTKTLSSTTTTPTTVNKLIDSAGLFTTTNLVKVGDIIYNNTVAAVATVSAVDSATSLSLSADIMLINQDYTIYRKSTEGALFYVAVAGDLKVTTAGGEDVLFVAHPAGYTPLNVKRIWATGTAATGIVALW